MVQKKRESFGSSRISYIFLAVAIVLLAVSIVSVQTSLQTGESVRNLLDTLSFRSVSQSQEVGQSGGFLDAQESMRDYRKDVLLLKFKEGLEGDKNENQRKGFYKRYGLSEVKNIEGVVRVVSVPPQALDNVMNALSHNPMVEFVEKDYFMEFSTIPNDPRWNDGYYVATMDYVSAWNVSTGASEVIVANPDSGIDMDHPDLVDVLLTDLSYNSYDGSNNVEDILGHGTSTAGVIGATTNNGVGIASAPWIKKIIPIKINAGGENSVSYSVAAEGVRYAADNGAKVVSLSTDGACSSTLSSAGAYVRSKGGLFFMSAGNSNAQICFDSEEDPNIIVVSATTSSDAKASWSNYGPDVDLAAPGAGVLSTKMGGGYGSVSGTSFSSPLAASVAALLFSTYPSATHLQVENAMFAGADDLGAAGRDDVYGHGRVNAFGAMVAMGEPVDDKVPPQVQINVPSNGDTVIGSITVEVGATDQYGISSVELYIDDSLYGTHFGDSNSYDFFWDVSGYANGPHTLRALATDNYGNVNTHDISIDLQVDSTPPQITITYPTESQVVTDKFLIVTTDVSSNTDSVDFYLNGVFRETDTTAPYSMSKLNTKQFAGQDMVVRAVAYTASGFSAEDSVNFKIAGGGGDDGGGDGFKAECSDRIDNDGDGLIDYCKNSRSTGCDPQCSSRDDSSESS